MSKDDAVALMALDMRDQYARFCGLGNEAKYADRYRMGYENFPVLCSTQGVAQIGIDWQNNRLVIGTSCVDVQDSEEQMWELGVYICTISIKPPGYGIENLTRTINNHPHPHINTQGGMFCMLSGQQMIMVAIADGKHHTAVASLMAALWMRPGKVIRGFPYADLSHWPPRT